MREALEMALDALENYKGFIDDAHIIEGQWHWIDGLDTVQIAIKKALAQPPEPRNFCPRCGKRTADLTVIHTCTPPRGLEMT